MLYSLVIVKLFSSGVSAWVFAFNLCLRIYNVEPENERQESKKKETHREKTHKPNNLWKCIEHANIYKQPFSRWKMATPRKNNNRAPSDAEKQ